MASNGSEAIQVVVRIRPMQKHEISRGDKVAVIPLSEGKEIQIKTDRNEAQRYRCNTCFSRETSQVDFFEESNVKSLIDSVVEGYRACVFAFGQTGAGKTYTVVGPSKSITPGDVDDGLIGRSLDYMFSQLDSQQMSYSVRISCLEIYHENVYDLLSDDRKPASLPVREHAVEGFFLEGSKMVTCTNFKQACTVIDIAMRHRHIGENDINIRSNRSHCITEIYVDVNNNTESEDHHDVKNDGNTTTSRFTKHSHDMMKSGKLSLIDLAGSERLKSSRTTRTRLQEAGFINKSLYVLGKVIAGLARTHGNLNHRDVCYRDSKLTKLLINSLGGRGRTMLVACVTEASGCQAETLRTLKFSMSCARIKNRPVRFLDPQQRLVAELRDEIKRLRTENKILRTSLASAPSDLQASLIKDMDQSTTSDSMRRILSAGEDKFLSAYDNDDDLMEERSVRSIKKASPMKSSTYGKYQSTNYRSNYGGYGKRSNYNGNYIASKKKPLINPYQMKKGSSPMKISQSEKLFLQDKRLQSLQDRLAKLESEHDDAHNIDARSSVASFQNRNMKPWQVNHNNDHPNRKGSVHQTSSSSIVNAADIIEGHRNNHNRSGKDMITHDSNASSMIPTKSSSNDKTSLQAKASTSSENDMLSDFLDALDGPSDDKKQKKNTSSIPSSNVGSKKNSISSTVSTSDASKKVSPYVAHLTNNAKRIKELSNAHPQGKKASLPPRPDQKSKIPSSIPVSSSRLSQVEKKASISSSSSSAAASSLSINSNVQKKNSNADDLFASFLDGIDSDDDDDKKKKSNNKKSINKTLGHITSTPVAPGNLPYGRTDAVRDDVQETVDDDHDAMNDAQPMQSKSHHIIASVKSKLDLLEQQLVAERRDMEDNPGHVTAEEEHQLNELEKEAISMRMELQLSNGSSSNKIQAIVAANRMSNLAHDEDGEDDQYNDDDFDDDKDDKSHKINPSSYHDDEPASSEPSSSSSLSVVSSSSSSSSSVESSSSTTSSQPSWIRTDPKSPKISPTKEYSPKFLSDDEMQSKPKSFSYLAYKKSKSPRPQDRDEEHKYDDSKYDDKDDGVYNDDRKKTPTSLLSSSWKQEGKISPTSVTQAVKNDDDDDVEMDHNISFTANKNIIAIQTSDDAEAAADYDDDFEAYEDDFQ